MFTTVCNECMKAVVTKPIYLATAHFFCEKELIGQSADFCEKHYPTEKKLYQKKKIFKSKKWKKCYIYYPPAIIRYSKCHDARIIYPLGTMVPICKKCKKPCQTYTKEEWL